MQEICKELKLSRLEYYGTHLAFVNCILPVKMTLMEIKVLASFMSLDGAVAQYKFGPTGRKIVMGQLGLSPAGLSNFVVSLTRKGYLIKGGDIVAIRPLLIPENGEQNYRFKLISEE